MSRVVEAVVPRRLGVGFRWLLASTWVSNLGDGFALAAGPLLVASLTSDPRLVAAATLLQQLPWLLVGLQAGALADRLDRRRIIVAVDLTRAGVLVLMATSIATQTISIGVVLATLFVLGVAEVFADNASGTMPPMLVDRDDLGLANSRILVGYVTVNQLVGPPIGATLFAAARALPFAGQALVVALGAVLVNRVRLPEQARPEARPNRVRADIAEGMRWAWRNAAVRTLVLTILTFNITFGAAWSVLVLYARERLGLHAVGFGLLTTVGALGGLLGTVSYGAITRRISLSDVMRIGLIIETFTHLALALTTNAAIAMGIFFVFGAHAFIWATTSVTVRQRAVPLDLQGRVASVNSIGTYGGLVAGSALGGLIAGQWGITAPFWFAFVGSAVFVLAIWRQLAAIKHADTSPVNADGAANLP